MSKLDIINKIAKNAEKIKDSINNQEKQSREKDTTFWTTPWDENKKIGSATIAFLPFGDLFEEGGTPSPYVFIPIHNNLQGTKNKKYWNILCPSIKKDYQPGDCPICEKFFEYYNGTDADKKLAQNMGLSRKRQYFGNIIVLKNDSNPEEVGKIFKWKFGVQIKSKIANKLSPIDDDEPIMIHNINNILPMKIKISEKDGYRNFELSEWAQLGKSVADYIIPDATAKEKEKYNQDICDNLFKIKDYINDDDYKSVFELKKILNDVLEAHNQKTVSDENVSINVENQNDDSSLEDIINNVSPQESNSNDEDNDEESNIEDDVNETDDNEDDDIDLESLFKDD